MHCTQLSIRLIVENFVQESYCLSVLCEPMAPGFGAAGVRVIGFTGVLGTPLTLTDPCSCSVFPCCGAAELQVLGLPGLAPSADGPAHAPDDTAPAAAAGPDGKENLEGANVAAPAPAAAGVAAGGKAAGSLWLTMTCLVLGTQVLRSAAAWPYMLCTRRAYTEAGFQIACMLIPTCLFACCRHACVCICKGVFAQHVVMASPCKRWHICVISSVACCWLVRYGG